MKPFDLMKKLILLLHCFFVDLASSNPFLNMRNLDQDLHYKKVFINFFLHGERNFQCSDTQTTDHSNNRTQWRKILSQEVCTYAYSNNASAFSPDFCATIITHKMDGNS